MTGTPIDFVSWRKAVKMLWEDRAITVKEDSERILRSPSFEMYMPRVIRAKNWVERRRRKEVPFSRRNLFLRDDGQCQYCGVRLKTDEYSLDHVIPRSKGGQSTWENLVVACLPCNKFKDDDTLEEAGMALRRKPVKPKTSDPRYTFKLHIKKLRPEWKEWVDGGWLYWNVELEK
jgi:5-methylcytosine-specific restriction endonuclease McrA